ncbi:NAD-dependent epimerase/dehydratase family protein [Microlunatus ginsengisoli]|uniref:NAD(P)-dependent oxidoreductase n=1 Tax=Microlunatus ginsengisoli TaxID=363863 RepID=A0ABP7ASV4_9ACTN
MSEPAGTAPRRVCVTGSSGLLGHAVVAELLAAGYEVVGADRLPPRTEHPAFRSVTWHGRDVGELARELPGCTGMVHLAAIPQPYLNPDDEVFANNTTATFAALQAAVGVGITRIAIASSISAYGMAFAPAELRALYVPLDESHPIRAADPYAASKEADEVTARMFCRRYELSIAALRFAWVASREAQLDSAAVRGEPAGGQELRNLWAYVDDRDAARACRLALEAAEQRPYGFAAMHIVAADSLAREPLGDLIARDAPEIEIRRDLGQTGGAWAIDRAESLIGWRPAHSWRHLH